MPLPTGTISFSDVNTELGRTSTTAGSLEEAPVRTLAGKPTSQSTISMADLQGKANALENTIVLRLVNSSDASLQGISVFRGRQTSYTKVQDTVNEITFGTSWCFSPDGMYIAITRGKGFNTTAEATVEGALRILKKQANGTYTLLANSVLPNQPAVANGSANSSVAISPDNTYWVFGYSSSVYIYKKGAGDTWTLLQTFTYPGTVNTVSFAGNGAYFSVGHGNNPWFAWYSRSADTFTALSNPSTDLFLANQTHDWSSDGLYLMCGCDQRTTDAARSLWRAYSRSANTLTRMTLNPTLNGVNGVSLTAISPSTTYVAIGVRPLGSNPAPKNLYIYKRSGSTLTELTAPVTLPAGTVVAVKWSADEKYLIVGQDNASTRSILYERSGDTFTSVGSGGLTNTFSGNFGFSHDWDIYPRAVDGLKA